MADGRWCDLESASGGELGLARWRRSRRADDVPLAFTSRVDPEPVDA